MPPPAAMPESAKPLVTIGITAYNAADSVAAAVASALAQTWRPIEIVAVDDCSSDGTRDELERLAGVHPELRMFSNAVNGGVAVSRNRILAEARGAFVAFFDDDDESMPERVAEQYRRICDYERDFASSALVICHTARQLVYPDGLQRVDRTMGETPGRLAPAGSAVARRILLGTPLKDGYGACPTCSQMARLATYRNLGGFDPALRRGEDTDLNIRLALAGGHLVGIARPLVRQRMTRTSDKGLAEEYRNMLVLIEKHRGMMEEAGQYGFCRAWLDAKQAWLEGRRAAFAGRFAALALAHPVLTARRFALALPNAAINRAFRRFHAGTASATHQQ